MKKTRIFFFSIFYNISASYAVPQNFLGGFLADSGTPITTISPNVLDKGTWSLSQRTEYYQYYPISDARLLSDPNAESQKQYLYNYIITSYGLTDNFMAGLTFPYLNVYGSRGTTPIEKAPYLTVENLGDISGFSDQTAYGIWQFLDQTKNATRINSSLFFGVTAPTGKTNSRMKSGELYSGSDQPGSGTWEPFVGIILSKNINRLSFSGNFIYTQATKGTQNTTSSNYFDYFFAGVYSLVEDKTNHGLNYNLYGVLELIGEYATPEKMAGAVIPDTGYNTVEISPGLRLGIGENISCYLSANLPITEVNKGVQTSSNFYVFSGVDFTF